MDFQNIMFGVLVGIFFIMVLIGIVNTNLMTVFERVREIGTLMAIGLARRHIIRLFLLESLFISVMGGVIGGTLGVILVTAIGHHGVRFEFPAFNSVMTLRPFVTFGMVAVAIGFAVFSGIAAALYPASRAAKMNPADALRSI